MERKVSSKKYLLAFILTLIVFAGGISMGILFENIRLNHSKQLILEERANLKSLEIQKEYIGYGLVECEALNQILETNVAQLNKKMDEVIRYEKKAFFSREEFELQLQDYFLTEIEFLLIAQEVDKKCSKDNVKVLFFYDENQFDTQGSILDYIKKVFGPKVMVFSLDSNFKREPMINILLASHNIKQFPSIVIENEVFQGHMPLETLMEKICEEFTASPIELPEECQTKKTIRTGLVKNPLSP